MISRRLETAFGSIYLLTQTIELLHPAHILMGNSLKPEFNHRPPPEPYAGILKAYLIKQKNQSITSG
jgi:hypothetical protein